MRSLVFELMLVALGGAFLGLILGGIAMWAYRVRLTTLIRHHYPEILEAASTPYDYDAVRLRDYSGRGNQPGSLSRMQKALNKAVPMETQAPQIRETESRLAITTAVVSFCALFVLAFALVLRIVPARFLP